jgi:hypothetical protein
MALSELERRVLDFERSWWREAGTKKDAIAAGLGVSSSAYYAMLADLVTRDDALAYDPLVIRRLRRRDEARRREAFEPRRASSSRRRPE